MPTNTLVEAELLATGDELISGAISDTNGAWAAAELRGAGVTVRRMNVVGDGFETIVAALREAAGRARVVVVSGGLGPTDDDRTAAAAAAAAGVAMARRAEALDHVREMFRRIGRPMTANNEKQADFPEGAELLANPVGTALGFSLGIGDARLFFLPGVPHEYRRMLTEQVLTRLPAIEGARTAVRVLRVFGIGESQLETDLRAVTLPDGIELGYRATWPELHLRLYAAGTGDLDARLDAAEASIAPIVGARLYGRGGDGLAATIGRMLTHAGQRVAVAESCTGGLLGATLTDVPGSSAWFECGYVTYSNRAKTDFLGVPPELLEAHGAVSREVASAMAAEARRLTGVDYALSITGIAGPSGGTPDKPVGTVWIGLASPARVSSKLFKLRGDRERIRMASVWTAMDRLRRLLLEVPEA